MDRSQLQTRRVHMSLLGLSVGGLGSLAVRKITQYTRVYPNSCHGSNLPSKRAEEWPPVALIFRLHLCWESQRSRPLHPGFLCWAANQNKDHFPRLRPLALKIAQFLLYLRLATVLDLSSPPLNLHSLQFVEVGGWENRPPQIA